MSSFLNCLFPQLPFPDDSSKFTEICSGSLTRIENHCGNIALMHATIMVTARWFVVV